MRRWILRVNDVVKASVAQAARLAMDEAIQDLAAQPAKSGCGLAVQPVVIEDARWNELFELTGGTAAVCYQCGVCTAICPWGQVKDDTFSFRSLIRTAQLGLDAAQEYLWLCTACGQCEAMCPRGVQIGDVIRGIRHLAWQDRQVPSGLPTVLWSLHGNNNPWEQPPSARSAWAADLSIPYFDQQQHEVLLYIGCTASYDRRVQLVARALASILRAGDVTFGYLADDEPCCGESALSLGHRPLFEEMIAAAAETFENRGASSIVTLSPHCYHAFASHLSVAARGMTIHHYPQYLALLVRRGQLSFDELPARRVTFHDPCYLARHHNDESSARIVLDALPGIEALEMTHHGQDTICCGGGGGRMWLETPATERFADVRLAEAVEIEVDCLITACPFCLSCLDDSVKAQKRQELRVLDLAELVSETILPGN
jgi:Fe-S oxidoreductase